MGYIQKSLLDGEKIVYQTRRHKIIFALPFLWLMLAAILFVIRAAMVFKNEIEFALLIFGYIFLALGVGHVLVTWVRYLCAEFGVTNHRVIVKEGFIKRNTIEVFLNRVESVKVDQSIWGRLLDFGTIIVSGTGGVVDPLSIIRAPLEFKKQVQQQLAHL